MKTPDQINQQTNNGLTALMMAAVGNLPGHPAIVKMLTEAEQQQGSDAGLDLTDNFGNTALHYAADGYLQSDKQIQANKKEIYNFLVERGADPLKENDDGETPVLMMGYPS